MSYSQMIKCSQDSGECKSNISVLSQMLQPHSVQWNLGMPSLPYSSQVSKSSDSVLELPYKPLKVRKLKIPASFDFSAFSSYLLATTGPSFSSASGELLFISICFYFRQGWNCLGWLHFELCGRGSCKAITHITQTHYSADVLCTVMLRGFFLQLQLQCQMSTFSLPCLGV